jgi:hypothetical protein
LYLQIHQVDSIADSEWNSLVASEPKECIINATQQFFVEASLLSRKWQDKVDNFQEVRKRALKLIPELGLCLKKRNQKQPKPEVKETHNQNERKNNRPTQRPRKR